MLQDTDAIPHDARILTGIKAILKEFRGFIHSN